MFLSIGIEWRRWGNGSAKGIKGVMESQTGNKYTEFIGYFL